MSVSVKTVTEGLIRLYFPGESPMRLRSPEIANPLVGLKFQRPDTDSSSCIKSLLRRNSQAD